MARPLNTYPREFNQTNGIVRYGDQRLQSFQSLVWDFAQAKVFQYGQGVKPRDITRQKEAITGTLVILYSDFILLRDLSHQSNILNNRCELQVTYVPHEDTYEGGGLTPSITLSAVQKIVQSDTLEFQGVEFSNLNANTAMEAPNIPVSLTFMALDVCPVPSNPSRI